MKAHGALCPAYLACIVALTLPVSASGADVGVTSQVPEFLVTALTALPEGPHPQRRGDNCDDTIKDAVTPAGRYVQDRGWGVISEMPLGRYHLVSFGGEFISGTSGSCAVQQGNVGVFDRVELLALLYTVNEADELIGELAAKEDGALRLWNGEFLRAPVADIEARANTIVVKALSSEETLCNGAVSVPNVYGLPITEARETLMTAGWEPVPQEEEEGGQQIDLHKLGITETIGCAGTGFAYCSYAYRSPEASLMLSTAGELYEANVPEVVRYLVTCGD